MEDQVIEKIIDDKRAAKVVWNKCGCHLFTLNNGSQWLGAAIYSVEVAEAAIEVLKAYVKQQKQAVEKPKLEWSHTLLDGKPFALSEAEETVAKLGEGWRLPTRQELESLLDLSRHGPAIDTSKYPDVKRFDYWTSTPCAWDNDTRWLVRLYDGVVYGSDRSTAACVRAVRDGQ